MAEAFQSFQSRPRGEAALRGCSSSRLPRRGGARERIPASVEARGQKAETEGESLMREATSGLRASQMRRPSLPSCPARSETTGRSKFSPETPRGDIFFFRLLLRGEEGGDLLPLFTILARNSGRLGSRAGAAVVKEDVAGRRRWVPLDRRLEGLHAPKTTRSASCKTEEGGGVI